jgi:hypothetical protein
MMTEAKRLARDMIMAQDADAEVVYEALLIEKRDSMPCILPQSRMSDRRLRGHDIKDSAA